LNSTEKQGRTEAENGELNRQDAKVAEEEEERGGEWEEVDRARIIERIEPREELDDLARRVIRAAIEVHRHLGPGFLEIGYEEALSIELRLRGIPFERQKLILVGYEDRAVGEGKLDILVNERLIVELKAVETLSAIHKAQVISYLRATRLHLGLLINFNVPVLKNGLQRVILS
jgi:GxxExxY protein